MGVEVGALREGEPVVYLPESLKQTNINIIQNTGEGDITVNGIVVRYGESITLYPDNEIVIERIKREEIEDKEARLDCINLHAELSMLHDRVQSLEEALEGYRRGNDREWRVHKQSHCEECLQHDDVQNGDVTNARSNSGKSECRCNLFRGNQDRVCLFGIISIRNLDVTDVGKIRRCVVNRGANHCDCSRFVPSL